MGTRVYVGNLYVRVTKQHLKHLFSRFGEVRNVDMIEGTGYGYVEMAEEAQAAKALRALNGSEYMERVLQVRLPEAPEA